MKRYLCSAIVAAALAVGALLPSAGHAASTMRVTVRSVKPATVTPKHAAVTFHLKVTGLTLDAKHLGKAPIAGHGHIQLYVGAVPKDAYARRDLKHHWLASLAAPDFTLRLSPAILGGTGKHRIIIALAKNNYVLYHMPLAYVTITAR